MWKEEKQEGKDLGMVCGLAERFILMFLTPGGVQHLSFSVPQFSARTGDKDKRQSQLQASLNWSPTLRSVGAIPHSMGKNNN
jgi:hypothetical protein